MTDSIQLGEMNGLKEENADPGEAFRSLRGVIAGVVAVAAWDMP
jgi:hypothetical protein